MTALRSERLSLQSASWRTVSHLCRTTIRATRKSIPRFRSRYPFGRRLWITRQSKPSRKKRNRFELYFSIVAHVIRTPELNAATSQNGNLTETRITQSRTDDTDSPSAANTTIKGATISTCQPKALCQLIDPSYWRKIASR